jgi:hypothetical protein
MCDHSTTASFGRSSLGMAAGSPGSAEAPS